MIFTGRSGYPVCAGAAVTPKVRATNVAAIHASERQNRSIVFPPRDRPSQQLFFAGPTMRHSAGGGNAGRAWLLRHNLTGYGNRSRTDVAFADDMPNNRILIWRAKRKSSSPSAMDRRDHRSARRRQGGKSGRAAGLVVEEQSDEAIHSTVTRRDGLLRFARNDEQENVFILPV